MIYRDITCIEFDGGVLFVVMVSEICWKPALLPCVQWQRRAAVDPGELFI